ncbi:tyrosinase [Streptomyces pluripotens]|uniref:Tyrosinase n=1 Tax=Streptomyces pluripotens TaxID=1355015 RepID=A0A221P779_9ACTN|nr:MULTISPECIES: tyrosinase cofactor [Streptomyces]ARP73609.1 tyrosinase [Streptomyces pluripotens]ASN27858.1 tyrosinase [Streptomyces pluripotens]KIE23079.1 tyrosinase [Streptomyces sp. MUSC 125]MCH0560603.1 tyrosinase cofactor [Streptomyces sp. MUM 16J]
MPDITRRRALTAAAALAATAGAVTAVAPDALAVTRSSPDTPGTRGLPGASAATTTGREHTVPAAFDEVYRGRRIQGRPSSEGGHHHEHGGGYAVFVDGMQLHVMRNADGTWISVVSHYDPVATPHDAARAAVNELQGAALLPFPLN